MLLVMIMWYNFLLGVVAHLQHIVATDPLNEYMFTTIRNSTNNKFEILNINNLDRAEFTFGVRHLQTIDLGHLAPRYGCKEMKLCCSCLQHSGWLEFDNE